MTSSPLLLSLWVSTWAGTLALVSGTGISWILVKSQFRFKWALEGATLLALVLPPTVLGYYLLLLLGRQGLGPLLERIGLPVVFAWPGAVIAATVAAIPLVVQLVRTSLAEVSKEIEDAGRVDGCTRWQLFWHIDLGIAWRGIVAGGLLGFLRALGDFGATLMVAGNIPGRTQTLSMALYDAVQTNNTQEANGLVLLLSVIAFGVLSVALQLSRSISQSR
jgi:molybdate transport system permease protein